MLSTKLPAKCVILGDKRRSHYARPIDYIIVGLEGNKFDGSFLAAAGVTIESGVISHLAMAGVVKDTDGTVSRLDAATIGDEMNAFSLKYLTDAEIVSEDVINEVGELPEPSSTAGENHLR